MNIDITPENLLIQLGYPVNDATLAQMNRIIENTKGFDHFAKHILTLHFNIQIPLDVVLLTKYI